MTEARLYPSYRGDNGANLDELIVPVRDDVVNVTVLVPLLDAGSLLKVIVKGQGNLLLSAMQLQNDTRQNDWYDTVYARVCVVWYSELSGVTRIDRIVNTLCLLSGKSWRAKSDAIITLHVVGKLEIFRKQKHRNAIPRISFSHSSTRWKQ